jgi:hypothetical protein
VVAPLRGEQLLEFEPLRGGKVKGVELRRERADDLLQHGDLRRGEVFGREVAGEGAGQRERGGVADAPDLEPHREPDGRIHVGIVPASEVVQHEFGDDDFFRTGHRQPASEKARLEVGQGAADGKGRGGLFGPGGGDAAVGAAVGADLGDVGQGGDRGDPLGRQRHRRLPLPRRGVPVEERLAEPLLAGLGHVAADRDLLGRCVLRVRGRVVGVDDDPPEVVAALELGVDERPHPEPEGEAERHRTGADGDPDEGQGRPHLLPPQPADGEPGEFADRHGVRPRRGEGVRG